MPSLVLMRTLSGQIEVIAFQLLVDGWRPLELAPLYEAAARLRAAHWLRDSERWDSAGYLRWIEGLSLRQKSAPASSSTSETGCVQKDR
jgi:hypothetical protein